MNTKVFNLPHRITFKLASISGCDFFWSNVLYSQLTNKLKAQFKMPFHAHRHSDLHKAE